MKRALQHFGSFVLTCVLALTVRAQTTSSGASAGTKSPADLRPVPATALTPADAVDYALDLNWNDSQVDATVSYNNTSAKPLKVAGIQCSGGIFIVDYPSNIAPNGSGKIDLIFAAAPGTQSEAEFIKLRTDGGDKLIRIALNRPVVASFDQPILSWNVGATAAGQSVVLTLTNGVKATGVKAMLGNSATINDLGGGKYRITVLPKGTAKQTSFPVFVTLDPAVPGATPIITCTIGSND